MDKKQIKLLREIFYQISVNSNTEFQLFHRFWEVLDYLGGSKTPEFVHRLEK